MLCHSGFEIVRGGQYNSNKKQTILNACLVAVSLGFFAWDNVGNVGILLSLVIFNYIAGMAWKECRGVLLLGIFYDLSVLVKYKYLSLILSAFHVGKTEELLAPLGISFIIFHCISYLMDLYQKKAEPEHNLIDFALYITFFPKLIQGPIVKYRDMKAEIKQRKQISLDSLADGMGRFIIGLSKKVLIADILSQIVTDIFNLLSSWGMDVPTAWIGCLAYTVQIYMDFSGYSDMAIGLGRIFGFYMQENFNFPYRSQSITEFWRRWHISLGNWFRDYLYIPLGGNRRGNVYINLFLVFAATGIWHGAGILFLLWGIGHGLCVVIERRIQREVWYQKIPGILKWVMTMLIVSIGWLTFRLPNLEQMCLYLRYMFGAVSGAELGYLPFTWRYFCTPRFLTLMGISAAGISILGNEKIQEWGKIRLETSIPLNAVKYAFLLLLWCLCFITIVATEYSPFIYFQF